MHARTSCCRGHKLEPPAIASWETWRAINSPMDLYLYTGSERYIEAAGLAAPWVEASQLPDGQWARFYKLQTNRPLYMTADYGLTCDAGDTPRHYGFRGGSTCRARSSATEVVPAALAADDSEQVLAAELSPRVERVVAALDHRGRWL